MNRIYGAPKILFHSHRLLEGLIAIAQFELFLLEKWVFEGSSFSL